MKRTTMERPKKTKKHNTFKRTKEVGTLKSSADFMKRHKEGGAVLIICGLILLALVNFKLNHNLNTC